MVASGARVAAGEDSLSVETQLGLIVDVIDAANRLEPDTESTLAACAAAAEPRGAAGRRAGDLVVHYHRLQQRLQDLPLDQNRLGIADEVDERLRVRMAILCAALQLAFTANPSVLTESARLAIPGLGSESGRLLDLRARLVAQLLDAGESARAPSFPGLTVMLKNSPLSPRRRRTMIAAMVAAVLLPVLALLTAVTHGSPPHPARITWINDTGMDLYVHPCAYQTCDESDQRTAWVIAPSTGRAVTHTWAEADRLARFAVSTSAQGQGPLRCIPAPAKPGPVVRLASAQPCR